jgi:CRP/FNR family transcriptional regulator, cyclic AMP receptor protein
MKSKSKMAAPAGGFFATPLPASKITKYLAGATIVAQGDECRQLYYIERGLVKLTLVSHRGRAAVLGILGQSEFFGEGCLAERGAHIYSAVALVPSIILTIRPRAMMRLLEENRDMSRRFIHYLLDRNSRIEQELIGHLFNTSEKRLARMLLLLDQYSRQNHEPRILKQINQDTLAEMIGTTRSRVNFFMNRFRKQGMIDYNGGLKVNKSLLHVLED